METVDTDNSTGNNASNNLICPRHQETVTTQTIKTLAYCLIILLSLAGNSVVIVTVWRNISMRSVTNLFIANLAASDLLITFLGMPNMITQLYLGRKWIFGEALCKLVVFFPERFRSELNPYSPCDNVRPFLGNNLPIQTTTWFFVSSNYSRSDLDVFVPGHGTISVRTESHRWR